MLKLSATLLVPNVYAIAISLITPNILDKIVQSDTTIPDLKRDFEDITIVFRIYENELAIKQQRCYKY